MTELADAIYDILRIRVCEDDPRITYKELAIQLREQCDAFEHITHRSQQMYSALTEVAEECRRAELPCLAALVVRSDSGRPGAAYFQGSRSEYRGEQIQEWREEVEAVRKATYPPRE